MDAPPSKPSPRTPRCPRCDYDIAGLNDLTEKDVARSGAHHPPAALCALILL